MAVGRKPSPKNVSDFHQDVTAWEKVSIYVDQGDGRDWKIP
jgi:hypothetical protein